jgi:hypothetical protein
MHGFRLGSRTSLLAHTLFGLVGHTPFLPTMMAQVHAIVQVHTQRLIALISPRAVTPRTYRFHLAAYTASGINTQLLEVSHDTFFNL